MFNVPDYVTMSDVTFRGPRTAVFAHTSWRIPQHEHWAIRGPSGAGKSLFVDALTGRLPRLAGTLRHPVLEGNPRFADSIFGVLPPGSMAVASMDQHQMLLSSRGFHQLRWHGSLMSEELPVEAYLSYASVTRHNPFLVVDVDRAEAQRFETLRGQEVERWELGHLLKRPLSGLSNGELHRFLIARALMLEPRLLIVDEPGAGLDERHRRRLVENLSALSSSGKGVLYVVSRDEDVPATVTHELWVDACAVVSAGERRSRARTTVGPSARVARPTVRETSSVVVELINVTVRLGNVPVLDGVDFTIRQGERWALVGQNGAGKSTLLSLILADNPQAYSNHVVVGGLRLGPGTAIWDVKRQVGWVSPELDAHYPLGTPVIDVVQSGMWSAMGVYSTARQRPGAEAVSERLLAADWLERVGLSGVAAEELGGLRRVERRLAFLGRACVHRPRLLLLDEPCQGLDSAERARFSSVLDGCLAELRAAMVYVTHEAEELPDSIDHVLSLVAGRATGGTR